MTSALDMSGPGTSVLELAREYGTGLNLATIEYVRPGHTVSGDDPSSAELHQLITKVQRQGSLGIKLLGGHYPLTVAATARAIRLRQSWELIRLFTPGQPLMVPISRPAGGGGAGRRQPSAFSAYQCLLRGTVLLEAEETELALKALAANPNISCESYLSPLNGTSAEIIDGLPGSMVTRRCLKTGGFTEDEAGMERRFCLAGHMSIIRRDRK